MSSSSYSRICCYCGYLAGRKALLEFLNGSGIVFHDPNLQVVVG